MKELQLTHVALLGARMDLFQRYGVRTRGELPRCCIVPRESGPLADLYPEERYARIAALLPVWVHNIVTDPEFPQRERLMMALRRFEGELRDHRDDEVVSAVLSAGFRDQTLDPLDLPDALPMRERCELLMQIDIWLSAYRELENDLVGTLCEAAPELDSWMASADRSSQARIA
jgi:hypothetical protein